MSVSQFQSINVADDVIWHLFYVIIGGAEARRAWHENRLIHPWVFSSLSLSLRTTEQKRTEYSAIV